MRFRRSQQGHAARGNSIQAGGDVGGLGQFLGICRVLQMEVHVLLHAKVVIRRQVHVDLNRLLPGRPPLRAAHQVVQAHAIGVNPARGIIGGSRYQRNRLA